MVPKEERLTIWYDEMDGNDFNFVGKKNANLGEMTKAGIPVSPGFAVTIHCMDKFTADTGIKEKLAKLITTSGEVPFEVAKPASDEAIRLINTTEMPDDIRKDICENYQKLCEKCNVENVPVAVRSSGAVSMPGQMETYLNIRGEKDLIDYIRLCWTSAYNTEAIMYRMNKNIPFLFNIGTGIPKMVNSRVAGVIFTINPINGDPSKISIDASYGLGESVVSGFVTPDTYLIDKIVMEPIKTIIGSKEVMCVYREGGSDILKVPVPEEKRGVPCLTRQEMLELARIGKGIENYYGKAYDIEFGIDADMPFPSNVIILQVRPESVWSKKEAEAKTEAKKSPMDRLLGQLLTGVKVK